MLRQDEFRIDVGCCNAGTFMRVVHVPTGIARTRLPLGDESSTLVRFRLLDEIENELAMRSREGTPHANPCRR